MKNFLPTGLLLIGIASIAILPSPTHAADISGSGWRLWPDAKAAWKEDKFYLPSEVKLSQLPVNAPTGGWAALDDREGIPITLPSTVEEHYWGKFGFTPYTREIAAIQTADKGVQNGSYNGVSWWWRTVKTPSVKPGQQLILHVRGARLRTEVYCNGKLRGYSIMTELPFDSDITDAVEPGKTAQIALRITNPGGFLDWNDFFPMHGFQWGGYTFPGSHGFGGLDSGVTLDVRDDVAVSDLATINKPDLHDVHLIAEVKSLSQDYSGPVHFKISSKGATVWSSDIPITLKAGETKNIEADARVAGAIPWSVEHPELYQATATVGKSGVETGGRKTDFGFRFFTAVGVEKIPDPYLTLNDKRIVVRSAISWGFWGRNGLWPDTQMATREITAAKALGLNALQSHRNLSKPMVLDLQDRMGLLRYEEPGSGQSAYGNRYGVTKDVTIDAKDGFSPGVIDISGTGPDAEPVEFYEKYEEEKMLEMVKRDRSHPSLIMYTLQNEGGWVDSTNPRIYRIMREMRAIDPSRIIVLNSGVMAHRAQALMLPYSDTITYSNKTDLWGGWRDEHTVGGPGNYTQEMYTDPTHYSQRTPENGKGAISAWGEMLGVGTPDNFQQLVSAFDKSHPTGYDYGDDKRVLDATHAFLDKWGFRKAFPTDASYFNAIGDKSYFFWQKILEQARADNANDYLVISGWESTTIDNHSGIVDNHRFFKGDPNLVHQATLPEMLVVRPRQLVLAKGQRDLVDVFLVNETGRSGPHTLRVTVKRPNGSVIATVSKEVRAEGGNTYGQLLNEEIEFTADAAGMASVEATLTPATGASVQTSLTRTEKVNVIDPASSFQAAPKVAVLEEGQDVANVLTNTLHLTPTKYDPSDTTANVIVFASKGKDPDFDALAAKNGVPQGTAKTLDSALDKVKNNGARLVLWPNGERSARWMVQQLAERKVVTLENWVQHTGASWFGSWYIVRKHWLFDGLPTDCAMDWRYDNSWSPIHSQGDDDSTGGAILSAPGLEVACGYGNNEKKTMLGASAVVIPYGKGQVVWYCLPQMLDALSKDKLATNTHVAQRLLANAIFAPITSK
ncbi:MAG: glycoside hydrolase [Capsulimonas sp.]|nr:glycoside hydrolase [Capsulimonas sp.]